MADLMSYMNGELPPLAPYPYAPGQTKGGDTSEKAQLGAMKSKLNDEMRLDALNCFKFGNYSAEGIAMSLNYKWRSRYPSDGDFLQDVRRRCSELVKLDLITDSGERELSTRQRGPRANTIRVWKLKGKKNA